MQQACKIVIEPIFPVLSFSARHSRCKEFLFALGGLLISFVWLRGGGSFVMPDAFSDLAAASWRIISSSCLAWYRSLFFGVLLAVGIYVDECKEYHY